MPTSCFQTTHTKERSGNNSAVTLTQSRKCLPMVALGPWSGDTPSSRGCRAGPRTGHLCPRKSFPTGCRHGNLPKTYGWIQTLPGSQVQGQAEPRTLPVLTMGLLGDTMQGWRWVVQGSLSKAKQDGNAAGWGDCLPGRGRTLLPKTNPESTGQWGAGHTQTHLVSD